MDVAPIIAALYFILALVWAMLAHNTWSFLRTHRPPGEIYRLFPALFGLAAAFYLILTIGAVTMVGVSPEAQATGEIPLLGVLALLTVAAVGPVVRHMVASVSSSFASDARVGASWRAVNYGSGMAVGVVAVGMFLLGEHRLPQPFAPSGTLVGTYLLIMIVISLVGARGQVGWGPMRPSTLWGRIHYTDYLAGGAFAGLLLVYLAADLAGNPADGLGRHVGLLVVGLVGAVPFLVRAALVRRKVVMATVVIVATAAAFLGAHTFASTSASLAARAFVGLGAVLSVAILLVPGRPRLEAAIDRIVLRGRHLAHEELQAFLQGLGPDLGVHECCRRALAEVARRMEVPGAAVLLTDGGEVTHGDFALAALREVWPTGAAREGLPQRAFTWPVLHDTRLRTALAAADVAVVVPITSPRRRWGHLLVAAENVGWAVREEHVEMLETFGAQLALVLDAAELVARAIALERSLAHSEKLAAIGETAARIVHEIRNPVTAARSLAQQLAREPASPHNAEHAGLVVEELERVERQVQVLLRFARRDTFDLAPLDLAELARATAESYEARLKAAGVEMELALSPGTVVRADREKLRQVLVNLLDNAMDALAEARGPRRIGLTVGSANGTAMLRVADSGPGVAAHVLGRLFEPFFSLKEKGTGLGLAIAKRTVEAHGGTIEATSPPDAGLTMQIALPLSGSADRAVVPASDPGR